MLIRVATESDFKEVFNLVDELGLSHPTLSIGNFFVAEDGSSIVGVAHVEDFLESAYLSALGVLPECRGRGVAKQLVDAAMASVKKDIYAYTLLKDVFTAIGFVSSEVPKSIPPREIYDCDSCCEPLKCACMVLTVK
jgi:N-acetylglutamate synthase-like GNAT family acetyltransferase